MKDQSGKYTNPKGNGMNLAAKILLILMLATLPAALWLGGDWWKWVITAVVLVIAAAVADQDGDS